MYLLIMEILSDMMLDCMKMLLDKMGVDCIQGLEGVINVDNVSS